MGQVDYDRSLVHFLERIIVPLAMVNLSIPSLQKTGHQRCWSYSLKIFYFSSTFTPIYFLKHVEEGGYPGKTQKKFKKIKSFFFKLHNLKRTAATYCLHFYTDHYTLYYY